MVKCVVAIIASKDSIYESFKKVVVKSFSTTQNFEFFFLYDTEPNGTGVTGVTETEKIEKKDCYTDYYCSTSSKDSKSIYWRTIYFFKWYFKEYNVIQNYTEHKKTGLFFLRTNVSTLFDFSKLLFHLQTFPKELFFGGPFNGPYNKSVTCISGTCMIMSFDIVSFLIWNNNEKLVDIQTHLEDTAISLFIFKHKWKDLNTICIRRLDTIEMDNPILKIGKTVIFHKCLKEDSKDIYVFRFKTFDRTFDIKCMETMLKLDCNIKEYIKNIKLNVKEEGGWYSRLYCDTTFKINN